MYNNFCIFLFLILTVSWTGADPECVCLTSMVEYLREYKDIAYNDTDPLWHYQNIGYNQSKHWDCTQCTKTSNPPQIYYEFSVTCPSAISAYIDRVPDAEMYPGGPFQHYLDHVNTTLIPWHGERCLVHHNCTCLAARDNYLSIYPDVASIGLDPIYHYGVFGQYEQRTLACSLCNSGPIYMDDSRVDCPAAETNFITNYAPSGLAAEKPVFNQWYDYYAAVGTSWNYKLCIGYFSDTPPYVLQHLDQSCTCSQARINYLLNRNDVALAGVDPLFHFDHNGYSESPTAWLCSLCNDDPVFVTDPIAQCDAAKQRYATQYQTTVEESFSHYYNNFYTTGNAWHEELCPGVLPDNANQPNLASVELPFECTCLAARVRYLEANPDVAATEIDPVSHYVKYGHSEKRPWACNCYGEGDIYLNDTFCRTCTPALDNYATYRSVAYGAYEPFRVFWDFFYVQGGTWHCELCLSSVTTTTTSTTSSIGTTGSTTGITITTTTGGSTTGSTSPSVLNPECTCLAARSSYYVNNQAVLTANQDAVSHYNSIGRLTGKTWDCSLCSLNNLYIEDANCSAAAARYVSDYAVTDEDPFANYLDSTSSNLNSWHYELCDFNLPYIPDNCTCIAAVTNYHAKYPSSSKFDSVYHYKWFGASLGYTLECDRCTDSSFKLTDSVCNCPEAATGYTSDTGYSGTDSFLVASTYAQSYGNPWKCDLCSTSTANPLSTLTCNCTAARSLYLFQNPSVSGDPWNHYVSTGKTLGLHWDCTICNDTCPGVYSPNIWLSNDQASGFSNSTDIRVPAGCFYSLSGHLELTAANLYIYGTLRCAREGNFSISGKKIWVYGSLECGTFEDPFEGSLLVTLYGAKPDASLAQADRQGGDKSLAVFTGGKLDLHGAKLVSWTRLAAPAYPGDSAIIVEDTVDWEVGDTILLASTSPLFFGVDQSASAEHENRQITSINGKTIELSSPLTYNHLCESHPLSSSLTLRKRGEVGLLSGRNIRVKGDDSNYPSGFGAHIMSLPGSRSYASGIEISQAGQKAILARYPWHWHMLGSVTSGLYFSNNTITNSANRCATVHGTNNTVVAHNFCYNFLGHGYFLEDGIETGNLIEGNLGVHGVRPAAGEAIIASDDFNGPHSYGPAVFWLSNPNNSLINNVAVDSYGGFWIQPEPNSHGSYANVIYNPQKAPWGIYKDNQAHGTYQGFTSCPEAGGSTGMETPYNIWQVTGLTIYGVTLGLWPCGTYQRYSDTIVYEAVLGMQVPTPQFFNNIAFVDIPRTAPTKSNAINLYDSGWVIDTILFKNYNVNTNNTIFRTTGAANFYSYTHPYNYTYQQYDSEWAHFVIDVDGSLTGSAGYSLVSDHPMMIDDRCHRPTPTANFGYVCPMHYVQVEFIYESVGLKPASIYRFNISNPNVTEASAIYFPNQVFPFYRFSAIANEDYAYLFVMPDQTREMTDIYIFPAAKYGDSVALEVQNIKNVPLALVDLSRAASCAEVWANKDEQIYYFDYQKHSLCIRLIATALTSPYLPQDGYGYYSDLGINLQGGNSTEGQPIINPGAVTLPHNATCVRAITEYWLTYPDVRLSDVDAVFHWTHYGYNEQRVWPEHLCQEDAHWPEDAECECVQANYDYGLYHPIVAGNDPYYPNVVFNAHEHFLLYREIYGYAYHCEFCPSIPNIRGPQQINSSCLCKAALDEYKRVNPDIPESMNSAYHWEHYGFMESRAWHCDLCSIHLVTPPNDCNCAAAKSAYLAAYPDAEIYNPSGHLNFHYTYNGIPYNYVWPCHLCDVPSTTTSASSLF